MTTKVILSGAVLSLVASAAAASQPAAGGFQGPDNLPLVTVIEAKKLGDDTAVKMQGLIVKSLGNERYEFKDETGTITVEIDKEDWHGVEATPETRIEVRGEVDKELNRIEVDVDTVRLAP